MDDIPPTLQEVQNLNRLSVFHYIVGIIHIAVCSFILLPFILLAPVGWSIWRHLSPEKGPHTYDMLVGVAFSGVLVLLAWIPGILTIYSGTCIKRRKRRFVSLVTGVLNCVLFPFGTALGLATLILLGRPSAKKNYAG
jgi:hypothetical protein